MLRWGNFCEAWKILSSTSKWCQWNRGRQSGYWVIPLKYSSSISTVLRTWKEWSQLIQCVKCQSTFKFPELRSSRNHRRVSVSSKLRCHGRGLLPWMQEKARPTWHMPWIWKQRGQGRETGIPMSEALRLGAKAEHGPSFPEDPPGTANDRMALALWSH